ncbi:hypothetical protein Pint_19050 [Pistacia integerrima]|uniref:Uncharacterized protein n=1 Tax=Pistacia integerrima TaxID=434235 RepID=A0ACC0YV51_9ROSI|nr:hypothetical protein Pint_19050 [Pistacia integerrima]
MALQTASPPSAQMVCNAFVEQYYHILYDSPETVYKFYHDSSVLSRPDPNGDMTSVTTMEGINEKILSLDFKNSKAEIKTADAQNSLSGGVSVLVTGCLTGKDNLRRKFVQSFFLAPQDNGYFVLNDIFRYVEDSEVLEKYPVNNVDDTPVVPSFPDSEPIHHPDPPASDPLTSRLEEDQSVSGKIYEPSGHERQSVNDEESIMKSLSHAVEEDNPAMVESVSSLAQDDAPKISYASIVKVAKGGSGPTKVYVATNTAKLTPMKTENQSIGSASPALQSDTPAPVDSDLPETSEAQAEVEGHSIYIRNLPLHTKYSELEAEFKRFGPIKQRGIQVRNSKGYCFGFVEFLSSTSVDNAIQASPIIIGGLEAVVERKKNTRVGSGRGRYPPEREKFWNDNIRGRGNYGGGRSFGRNQYGNRGDFSGQGRGSSGRVEGYQRGRGWRGNRSGAPSQTGVSASNSEE